MSVVSLIGIRFARLAVIKRAPNIGRQVAWECLCDCGKSTVTRGDHLKIGRIKSCGCLRVETKAALKHGSRNTPAYNSWSSMIQRCENPKSISYPRYGDLGIKVCKRWHVFENFLEDMGARPSGTSIDRYPNKGGDYEPGNCRWATIIEQNNNRRSSAMVTYESRSLSLADWERETGVSQQKIRRRLARGWSPERALELI